MPPFDRTPDKPQPFGYKVLWFAVKASDPAAVLDALEIGAGTPANWASGLAAAYGEPDALTAEPWLFVSPPVDGWVLVVSTSLPYPVAIDANRDIGERFDRLLARLTGRFDEVQFFGSHRVVSFVTWARAATGKPTSLFGFADADVLVNAGEQTPEEARLGFPDLSGLSPLDAAERMFTLAEEQDTRERALVATGLSPAEARSRVLQDGRDALPDETDVTDLAALWSLDPIGLEHGDPPPGVGLAARLPSDLAQ